MKNIAALLSALMLMLNFCGTALAEVPTPEAAAPETAVYENPAPEATVPPAEEPLATATPSPTPKPASIFDLMDSKVQPSPSYQVDMAAYYLADMIAAAEQGNVKAGRAAEENRNAAIDSAGSAEEKLSFDDLYLLARVIYFEAGSVWLDEEFRLCVGEVVLNRVASPEFPDTLYGVVYQKGQYPVVSSPGFAAMKPGKECVAIALRLLQGERHMVPSVVYQSDCIQGELFSMYSDMRLGNTYFCLSPNLELYPIE